eukprot:4337804-Amphidinium_carterae.2
MFQLSKGLGNVAITEKAELRRMKVVRQWAEPSQNIAWKKLIAHVGEAKGSPLVRNHVPWVGRSGAIHSIRDRCSIENSCKSGEQQPYSPHARCCNHRVGNSIRASIKGSSKRMIGQSSIGAWSR